MTRCRRLVLEIIQNSMRHLTAKEVFELAKEKMPNITFATIYNNLNFLVDDGQILRVQIVGQADRFDRTVTRHQHLICDECHELKDVDIPDFMSKLKSDLNLDITDYDLCLHYICDECKKRKGEKLWN